MVVNVMVRDHAGWPITTRQIRIADTCPVCGGPRGEPVHRNQCEDGEWYPVDTWENPCGHLDKYAACLKEAAAICSAAR